MTAEISDLIKQIKSKFIEVNGKFEIELSKNNSLNAEIKKLESLLEEEKKQNRSLENEISSLKKEVDFLNEQSNKVILDNNKNLEIDLLVREIDYCIQQLKRN